MCAWVSAFVCVMCVVCVCVCVVWACGCVVCGDVCYSFMNLSLFLFCAAAQQQKA